MSDSVARLAVESAEKAQILDLKTQNDILRSQLKQKDEEIGLLRQSLEIYQASSKAVIAFTQNEKKEREQEACERKNRFCPRTVFAQTYSRVLEDDDGSGVGGSAIDDFGTSTFDKSDSEEESQNVEKADGRLLRPNAISAHDRLRRQNGIANDLVPESLPRSRGMYPRKNQKIATRSRGRPKKQNKDNNRQ